MKISQEELAARADLHRNYVGGIERGERDIGITALASLARALGLSLASCSKSGGSSKPAGGTVTTTTVYRGVLAGGSGAEGTLKLTITHTSSPAPGAALQHIPTAPGARALAAVDPVTANMNFGPGGRFTFLGTFDPSSGALTLAGTNFVMNGTLASARLTGTYTLLSNPGTFVTLVTPSEVAQCGTWSGTGTAGADGGSLAFLITDGATITGIARNDNGTSNLLMGSLDVGTGDVICNFTSYVISGNVAAGAGSGTYSSTIQSRSGTWTTSTCSF